MLILVLGAVMTVDNSGARRACMMPVSCYRSVSSSLSYTVRRNRIRRHPARQEMRRDLQLRCYRARNTHGGHLTVGQQSRKMLTTTAWCLQAVEQAQKTNYHAGPHSLLLAHNSDSHQTDRFLAAAAPHSGDWLLALSISGCGLRQWRNQEFATGAA